MTTHRFKRAMDVLIASALLVLLSPLLLLISLAIWLTSPGPILFRQRRLGLGERAFDILKFRTMVVNAENIGPRYTMNADPRITWVGRILRKTSLDELPQLFNVLRGQMSLIGPRPYVGFELEGQPAELRELRASALPGISGLAQARGRSVSTPEKSLAHDLAYVRRCSLALDLRLMLETLVVVVTGRGSN
jgi:lipopolysaccharide/colanic/teichoic acid biosynthesis glycosyltransferase